MFKYLSTIIFDTELKLTLNLSILKKSIVLLNSYITVFENRELKNIIQSKSNFWNAKKISFLTKENQETQ